MTRQTTKTSELTQDMSNALEQRKDRRLRLAEQAKAIDEAAAGAMELFHGAEVSTEKELALACAVVDLRAALTEEVMQPIMSLMNSPLGFLTDKDPNKPVLKDGKWETPKPYGIEVVRDCVIAAKMLGFRVVGNEMNIISGKFYPAKAGFRRKLTDGKSFPGLTDFRDTYEVPRLSNGGAIVKARATWKRNGADDSLEIEIPVRLNAGMGSDAALGKAERKLCKRVHDILLGMSTPDADVETDGQTINVKAEVVRDEVPSVQTGAHTKQTEATPAPAPVTVDKPEPKKSPQDQLAELCVARGVSFDEWLRWAQGGFGAEVEHADSFETVSAAVAKACLRATEKMFVQISEGGAK